jgi:formamidopyrimidine-DNA glycosylase
MSSPAKWWPEPELMPELPEVETAARSLDSQVRGRQIAAIEKLDWERMVETPEPARFRADLPGRRIECVGRRAKWLLLTLDAGWTLALHLRMSGRVSVHAPEEVADTYTHLVLALDDGRRIFFHDTRKFGRARLLDAAGLAALDASLGPEPLGLGFDAAALGACLAGRRAALKPLLLNQTVLAGLGNIYVDESLWYARLHPQRLASSLDTGEVGRLHAAIREVLTRAIANKGSTLRNYRDGYGQAGTNQDYFNVYHRKGEPCPRCGTAVVRAVVHQRSTHFCPTCQPLP